MAKATEQQFNELHNLVTTEFLKRVKSGEASTQDLKTMSKTKDPEYPYYKKPTPGKGGKWNIAGKPSCELNKRK